MVIAATFKKLINKYRILPVTIKAVFWFTVCNFMLKGISFICMPLFTRLLSTDEYGVMNILTSYEYIFIIFATFELYLGAYQRGILKFKDDLRTFEQTIVMLCNVITLALFVLISIWGKLFTNFTGISMGLYSVMTLYFLVYAPFNCWLNKKRFEYDYKVAVPVTIAMTLIANLFPIITLHFLGANANVKVISTLCVNILFCIPFWVKSVNPLNLIRKRKQVAEYVSYALKYQGPLIFHSLSYYILSQSDRVMIGMFSDSTKVAFYSVTYSLANVIIIFQTSLNQVLKPWRFKKLEEKSYKEVAATSNLVIVLVGMFIIGFMLVVPEIFTFLFSKEYYEALRAMPPITISVYFLFLYSIFVDIESYYGKTNYIAYVSMFCAVLNIVLNYFGLKIFSYIVCAYTTLIGYIVMAFLHYIFMLRTCKKSGVLEIPVDIKFVCIHSLIMFMLFAVINMIYDWIIIRYVILLMLLIFCFVSRKKAIIVYKLIKKK